jgi:hypothetical protein
MKKMPSLSLDERRVVLSCIKAPFGINVANLVYDWPDCGVSTAMPFKAAAKRWRAPIKNLFRVGILQAYLFRNPEPSVKLSRPDFRRRMTFRLTTAGRAVAAHVRQGETMEPMPTLVHHVDSGKWEIEEIPARPVRTDH